MPGRKAGKQDRARYLETVVYVKREFVSELCVQAVEHARLAIEEQDAEHAKRALEIRESITYWKNSIERNKAEIARLSGACKPV